MNQPEVGGLLAPESTANTRIVRDLAHENGIQDTQLSSQKAQNVINVHRKDQKNFRDTYARARRHVSNGSRLNGEAVRVDNVLRGFKSLTREDSEQLVRAASQDKRAGDLNEQTQISEQKKKMTIKYQSPVRILRAASNEVKKLQGEE